VENKFLWIFKLFAGQQQMVRKSLLQQAEKILPCGTGLTFSNHRERGQMNKN